ncbi:MAG: hypothetical protein JW793_13850, partial [Acidobacteria bacterium]|nr:hypothetical protein [Acidobacteriota bacterium]
MFLLLGVVWPISADRPSAGARAEPGIRCNAVAGIGGYYRIGKCTPVTIHLENSGRSLDVRIQIRLSGELYTQAVSLPSPSRKKLVLHIVPDQDLHRLEIDLYSEGTLVKKLAPEMRRLSDEQILTVLS